LRIAVIAGAEAKIVTANLFIPRVVFGEEGERKNEDVFDADGFLVECGLGSRSSDRRESGY
jgi:hypothetical protein